MLITGETAQATVQGEWTKQDEFAKAALQAVLARADVALEFDTIARIAYDMADAMMEQRDKRP